MKKLVLALTAVAAFTGSALAADLPARTYTKAPDDAEPVTNWTGFYIFGGAGGGVWDADSFTSMTTATALLRSPSAARAATAGSARLVLATTGSSTSSGLPASLRTASSAASGTLHDQVRCLRPAP